MYNDVTGWAYHVSAPKLSMMIIRHCTAIAETCTIQDLLATLCFTSTAVLQSGVTFSSVCASCSKIDWKSLVATVSEHAITCVSELHR